MEAHDGGRGTPPQQGGGRIQQPLAVRLVSGQHDGAGAAAALGAAQLGSCEAH